MSSKQTNKQKRNLLEQKSAELLFVDQLASLLIKQVEVNSLDTPGVDFSVE